MRLVLLRIFARITRSPTLQPSDPPEGHTEAHYPSRILVIRPDHLGDLLFTTPALRILRQRYPDAHITALVGPWGEPVLRSSPAVNEIIRLPFPGFSRQSGPSVWQPYGLLRHWAQQLRGHYDLAFVLRFDHWWGALLAYLAGVPQRVGYAVPEVAPFLSHRVPYAAGRHEVEQNLRLIDWNLPTEHPTTHLTDACCPMEHPLEFRVPVDAVAWVKNVLPGPRPIVIHPGAGAAVKLWQAQKWAVVADTLAKETDAQILLTGSASERPLCMEIAAQMEAKAHVMAGETTLDRLAAILAECQLVLGVDSGPLHLAVAVGTPSIHLYGPVDSATFGPWGPAGRHRALVSNWPCIPCNRLDYDQDELAHHPCVREIDPNSVFAAAHEFLSV